MAVLAAETADEWQDIVSGCFVPLSCRSFEPSFRAKMEYVRLDPRVSVSYVHTGGMIAERTERSAAHAASDDLHISLQQTAVGRVSQSGRSVQVAPGVVTTYATDAPYHLDYSRPEQRQLIIQVSRRALDLPGRMIDAAMHRLVLPSAPAVRVMLGIAREASEGSAQGTALAETVVDLAATAIRGSLAAPVMPATRRGQLETLRDHVRYNFLSPDLTVDDLAVRHFMSRRRLYQLFDDAGENPAELIRSQRLAHAAKLLHSDDEQGIARIAAAVGFANATTFSRAFRRKYGVTPKDYRAGAFEVRGTNRG